MIRDIGAAMLEAAIVLGWAILLGFLMALMFVSTTPGGISW